MLANWLIESVKWKIIIKPLQDISLRQSVKAICSGITLSIFTPNRIGEYGGRVFYLKPINRIRAVFATMIGSYANILSVIIFGVAGILLQLKFLQTSITMSKPLISLLAILGFVLAFFLYYNLKHIPKLTNRKWFKSRARNILNIFTKYSTKVLSQLLGLSLLRYLVFATQYLLLLKIFGIKLSLLVGYAKMGLIYLTQTIIPTIAVAELGIRGNVALFFLKDVLMDEKMRIGVISATFSLWLINLIIPAIFGAFFILNLRFFKNK